LCQTANEIALTTATTATNLQLNSQEFDLQAPSGNSDTFAQANALNANTLNVPGATFLQTGASGSGSWSSLINAGGMASSGEVVKTQGTEQFTAMLDCANGTHGFSAACLIVGNYGAGTGAGTGEEIGFRGASCCSPQAYLRDDGSNVLHVGNLAGAIDLAFASNQPLTLNGSAGVAGQFVQSGGASANPAFASIRQTFTFNGVGNQINAGTGTTWYLLNAASTTSNIAYGIATYSGTFRNLYVDLNVAPGAGQTWTFALFVNGVASGVTCPINGAAAQTCSDTSNSVAISAGQGFSLRAVASSGTTAAADVDWAVELDNPS
jgi:hypothetical protein